MSIPEFRADGASQRVIEAVEAARLLLDSLSTLTIAISEERQQLPIYVANDDPRVLALDLEHEMADFLMKRVTQSLSDYHVVLSAGQARWIERQAACKE